MDVRGAEFRIASLALTTVAPFSSRNGITYHATELTFTHQTAAAFGQQNKQIES